MPGGARAGSAAGRAGGQGGGETSGGTGGKGHNTEPESALDQATRYAGYWNLEFSGAEEGGLTSGGIPGGFGSHKAGTLGQSLFIGLVVADMIITAITLGQSVAAKGGIVAYTKSGLASAKAVFTALRRLVTREGLIAAVVALKKTTGSALEVVAAAVGAKPGLRSVYLAIKSSTRVGEPIYIGITNNRLRRTQEYFRKSGYDAFMRIASGLTHGQARALEQTIIERYPFFMNKCNEIGRRFIELWYKNEIKWAKHWLLTEGKKFGLQ